MKSLVNNKEKTYKYQYVFFEREYYNSVLDAIINFMNTYPEYEYLNYTIDKTLQAGPNRFIGSIIYKKYE